MAFNLLFPITNRYGFLLNHYNWIYDSKTKSQYRNNKKNNRNTTQKIHRNKLRNGDWRLDCVSLDGGYLCFSHHQIKWSYFMFCFRFFSLSLAFWFLLPFANFIRLAISICLQINYDAMKFSSFQIVNCLPMFSFHFEWDWICEFSKWKKKQQQQLKRH